MADPSEIRAHFARMACAPEASLGLAHAALLVAAEHDVALDPALALAELGDWCSALNATIGPGWSPVQKLEALRTLAFGQLGLRPDREHYFDVRNSLLHEVMRRRQGIPLSIGILLLEMGWSVGLPLDGVGMPGHFLLRMRGMPADVLLDPFAAGQHVTYADAERLLADATGGALTLEPRMLRSIGRRAIIARLLANLKMASLRAGDLAGALAAVERLRLLHPEDANERRDQGLLLYELDRLHDARAALEEYLLLAPDAADREAIESRLLTIGLLLGPA